jgi:hypothetical protein
MRQRADDPSGIRCAVTDVNSMGQADGRWQGAEGSVLSFTTSAIFAMTFHPYYLSLLTIYTGHDLFTY